MKTTSIFLLIGIASIGAFSACSKSTSLSGKDIKLTFNDSAARYVLEHPANSILKERDSIWNRFEGYRVTQIWHKVSSVPMDWNYWEKRVNRLITKDSTSLKKSLELADNLKVLEEKEHDRIVRHISSYLPGKTGFEANVFFVACTVPYAFCVEKNKIGIDISDSEWFYDPGYLLNVVIHEIYHVGYRLVSPDVKYKDADPTDRDSFIRFHYACMLSEGIATFVGYKALSLFPANHRHEDYKMLEDTMQVKKSLNQINNLLVRAETEPIDTLKQAAWDIGVGERAYYIAGAYMCQKIEEKHGTKHLAALISKESSQFIREYNRIVPLEYRINLIEL